MLYDLKSVQTCQKMDFINVGSSQDIDEKMRWNSIVHLLYLSFYSLSFGMNLIINPEFTPLLAIWCSHLLNYK